MADDRCKHDFLPGQCLHCTPVPDGLVPRVVVTAGGSVFHRSADCEALRDGQRKVRRSGKDTHDPQNVALAVAVADDRGACIPCFPSYRPAAEAKSCMVLVNGNWQRGWLTRWERRPGGRWAGKVTYMVDGDQVTVTKDEAELRKTDP